MSNVIRSYFIHRLKAFEFLSLALLLSLLILSTSDHKQEWFSVILFLWLSFLVFRMLDDAGSIFIDRRNLKNRNYLKVEYYGRFVTIVAFISVLYFVILLIAGFPSMWFVLLYFCLSVGLYGLFRSNKRVLYLLALSKYPILLYAAIKTEPLLPNLPILLLPFVLMLSYDALESGTPKKYTILLLIICGALAFHTLNPMLGIGLTVLPIMIYLLLPQYKSIKFLPILYYPSAYFLLKVLTTT